MEVAGIAFYRPRVPVAELTCTLYMGERESIMRRCRKRGRGSVERVLRVVSMVVLQLFLPCALAKSSFYTSCFDHIRNADDNGDLLLSQEEYSKLLITISGGGFLLQNEMPSVFSEPYTKRLQTGSQSVDIQGIQINFIFTTTTEIGFMESFCRDIYAGLLSIFEIQMGTEQCKSAFQSADSSPTDENLSTDEYSFFVVSLTKDISFFNTSFNELTNTIQDVFNDMSVDSKIKLQLGADYLLEFCQRVAIAVDIGEVVNASMPTASPITKAPAARPVWIQPPTNLSPEFTRCRSALSASDLNNNSWLDFSEYGELIELLSNKRVKSASFGNLDKVFQDTYVEWISSGDIQLNLGSNPDPSLQEIHNLLRICKETTDAIALYESEINDVVYAPSLSPSVKPNVSISESLYQDCKYSMVLSDQNRNKVLDKADYVQFVSKLSTNTDLTKHSFADLDVALQDIFNNASSNSVGGISIAGFSPGQKPTLQEEAYFRNICMKVHEAFFDLESSEQTSLSPSEQFSPSESPSSHIVQISNELFRVCILAIDIADKNRDDMLDKDEYMRLLNRLTISEFSGQEFGDIEPILQNGFYTIAVADEIDVYGSKPGVPRTKQVDNHLQDVCEATYTAIEDYHSGKSFEFPVESPMEKCISALFDADLNHNSQLNEEEYIVFLNSFVGLNTSTGKSLDTLPFLLKENFKWISLRNDTISLADSKNSSSMITGDSIRLNWICLRIEALLDILSWSPHGSTFADFCNATTIIADRDEDGCLSEVEFTSLVEIFSAGGIIDTDLENIDDIFRRDYNKLKNVESGLIDIEEVTSGDLCEIVYKGINSTRSSDSFYQLCSMSANISDLDSNGILNQTEYNPFINHLLNVYGMKNSSLRYFGGLNSTNKEENYHKICEIAEYTFGISNSSMTSVTIRNSFFVANSVGISASSLTIESKERRVLDKAYVSFVEDQVLELPKLRARLLALQSSSLSTPEISQIVDIPCPSEKQYGQNCQKLDASFQISPTRDEDSSTIMSVYGNKTQTAIENGALQQKLATIDPNSSLIILNFTELFQPVLDPVETSDGESASNESTNFSLFVVIGVAIGASFFGAGLFYFLTSRKFVSKIFTGGSDVISVDELNGDTKQLDAFHSPIDRNSEDLEAGKTKSTTDFVFSYDMEDDCTAGISETTLPPGTNNSLLSTADFVVNDESESENEFRLTEYVDVDFQNVGTSPFDEDVEMVKNVFDVPLGAERMEIIDIPDVAEEDDVVPEVDEYLEMSKSGSFDGGKNIEGVPADVGDVSRNITAISNDSDETDEDLFDRDVESNDESSNCGFSDESRTVDTENEEELMFIVEDENVAVNEVNAGCITPDESEESGTVYTVTEDEEESVENVDVERIRVTPVDIDESKNSVVSGSESDNESDNVTASDDDEESDSVSSSGDEEESAAQSKSNVSNDDDSSLADESLDPDVDEESLSSLEEDNTSMNSTASLDSAGIRESYEKYRPIVEELVRKVVPDEIDNIDSMMEQFIGKEHELVATLRNMAESGDHDASSVNSNSSVSDESKEDNANDVDTSEDGDESENEASESEASTSSEESNDDIDEDEDDSDYSYDNEIGEDVSIRNMEVVEETEYSEETFEEEEFDESCRDKDDIIEEDNSSEYESD